MDSWIHRLVIIVAIEGSVHGVVLMPLAKRVPPAPACRCAVTSAG